MSERKIDVRKLAMSKAARSLESADQTQLVVVSRADGSAYRR
jgi:hypothetical protein